MKKTEINIGTIPVSRKTILSLTQRLSEKSKECFSENTKRFMKSAINQLNNALAAQGSDDGSITIKKSTLDFCEELASRSPNQFSTGHRFRSSFSYW
jgi:hypothetical protein